MKQFQKKMGTVSVKTISGHALDFTLTSFHYLLLPFAVSY